MIGVSLFGVCFCVCFVWMFRIVVVWLFGSVICVRKVVVVVF